MTLVKREAGRETPLAEPVAFVVRLDPRANAEEFAELRTFQLKLRQLNRAMSSAMDASTNLGERLAAVERALDLTTGVDAKFRTATATMIQQNRDIQRALRGDEVMRGRNENSPPSVQDRLGEAAGAVGYTLSKPTKTALDSYRIASEELAANVAKLRGLIEKDLKEIEDALDRAGAPPTPGRLPVWKGE
jgi:hypothetical protein